LTVLIPKIVVGVAQGRSANLGSERQCEVGATPEEEGHCAIPLL
jgi:hypothetical protein